MSSLETGTASESTRPVLVTGANGHLGRGLIQRASSAEAVRAVVRSQRAADQVTATREVDVRIIDYTDRAALATAAEGCRAVVHFVGIIKEGGGARYEDAHERTCEALAAAAADAGIERIVYLSIFGSRSDSPNACLASKGRAEQILLAGPVPSCVLRVPMVLGPGDYASFSLRKQATSALLPLMGGGRTLQQPIDSADVLLAVEAALRLQTPIDGALDLGGPECLSHRALVERAAALYGRKPAVLPLPLALAHAGIALFEAISSSPPMTRAMFDVLQHDDRVDPEPACKQLGITLTPLDETLRRCVGPQSQENPAR
jgi:NADH dehydrogenase